MLDSNLNTILGRKKARSVDTVVNLLLIIYIYIFVL